MKSGISFFHKFSLVSLPTKTLFFSLVWLFVGCQTTEKRQEEDLEEKSSPVLLLKSLCETPTWTIPKKNLFGFPSQVSFSCERMNFRLYSELDIPSRESQSGRFFSYERNGTLWFLLLFGDGATQQFEVTKVTDELIQMSSHPINTIEKATLLLLKGGKTKVFTKGYPQIIKPKREEENSSSSNTANIWDIILKNPRWQQRQTQRVNSFLLFFDSEKLRSRIYSQDGTFDEVSRFFFFSGGSILWLITLTEEGETRFREVLNLSEDGFGLKTETGGILRFDSISVE